MDEDFCSDVCANNFKILKRCNDRILREQTLNTKYLSKLDIKYNPNGQLRALDLILTDKLSIQDKNKLFGLKKISNLAYYFYKYKKLYLKYNNSSLWLDKDNIDTRILKDYERRKRRATKYYYEKVRRLQTDEIDKKARKLLEALK